MKVHYSSDTNEWATPQELFNRLNESYNFSLDPCCTKKTAKCKTFITKEQDGLNQTWGSHRVFCNPPYGREIGKWIKKAYEESLTGALVVCLIPSRTDTKYWHEYCMKARHIVLFRGRIKFERDDGLIAPAPFPSCLVIFGVKTYIDCMPTFSSMNA